MSDRMYSVFKAIEAVLSVNMIFMRWIQSGVKMDMCCCQCGYAFYSVSACVDKEYKKYVKVDIFCFHYEYTRITLSYRLRG